MLACKNIRSPHPGTHVSRFRRYISSHGASIQKTKVFLEKESSRLMERQAALWAAQTSSSQVPSLEGGVTEEMIRNIQEVGRSVTHPLQNNNWCDDWWDGVDFKMLSAAYLPSFCQEARNVVELQRAVQRGNTLLRRKEEQLQQLESSIAEEVRRKQQQSVSAVLQ